MKKPTGTEIKELRKRHHLTQEKLADSLYGVTTQQVASWESGRRNCPSLTWWAMVLTHDHIDLWNEEHS